MLAYPKWLIKVKFDSERCREQVSQNYHLPDSGLNFAYVTYLHSIERERKMFHFNSSFTF